MNDDEGPSKTTLKADKVRNAWADKGSHRFLSNRWVLSMWGIKDEC